MDPVAPPQNVRACDTPNESSVLQHFTSDTMYHLSGNRRFRNYEHFFQASNDAKSINGGRLVTSLGKFANVKKQKHEKSLPLTPCYLEKYA